MTTPPNANTCSTSSYTQNSLVSSSPSLINSSSKVSSSSQFISSVSSLSNSISSSNIFSTLSSNVSSSKELPTSSINSLSQISVISSQNLNNFSSNSSSNSTCTLPIPPYANSCQSISSISNSSTSISSLSSNVDIAVSSSSTTSIVVSSNLPQVISSQNSSVNSNSSSKTCSSSESNQYLNNTSNISSNECSEPIIRSGGGSIAPTSDGIIFLSNLNTISNTKPSDYFSIDDPYICGETLKGQVFSDNLDNLDKVYLDLESTIDSNLVYTILPYVNSNGTYQFGTISIEPSSYQITYYGINKDGTQTKNKSYIAEIKPKEDCVSLENILEDNRQRDVLDYAYSPIEEANISLDNLVKIAQKNQSQELQNANYISAGLVRTGGEKNQSIAAVILVLIVIIWLLQTNPIKQILVNKINQNLRFLMTLSILTTSIQFQSATP